MCRNNLPFNVLIISCKVQIPHLCKKGVDLHSSMFQGGDPGRDPTFSMIYQKTLNSPHLCGGDPERDHVFSQQYIQQTLIIPHSYGGDPRDPTLYSPCTWGCGMHEFFSIFACMPPKQITLELSFRRRKRSFLCSQKRKISYIYLPLFTFIYTLPFLQFYSQPYRTNLIWYNYSHIWCNTTTYFPTQVGLAHSIGRCASPGSTENGKCVPYVRRGDPAFLFLSCIFIVHSRTLIITLYQHNCNSIIV